LSKQPHKEIVMKTAVHEFETIYGRLSIRVDIFTMDAVEADAYERPNARYRVEGFVNDIPAGTVFSSGDLGSCYIGNETDDAARAILAMHHESRRSN
jgi:hypothetical protein